MKRLNIVFARLVLALSGLVLWASAAQAQPAYVNSAPVITAVNATTTPFTATSLTTGNLITVHVRWSTDFQLSSITDTASNTYTAVAPRQTISGTNYNQLWYAFNVTGNASNVVTLTFAGAVTNIYGVTAQYSGLATVSPLNSTTSAVATNTIVTSPSFSTGQTAALIVTAVGVTNGNGSSLTPSGTSGTYTSRTTTGPGVSALGDYIAATLQSGVTATYTDNVSDTMGMIVATFNTANPAGTTRGLTLLGVGGQ